MTAKKPWADLLDEQEYQVTLTKPILVGRTRIRPASDVLLKGKIIKEQANGVVTSAEPAAL